MSMENVLWGAPRIHGELLKLGFSVAQSTVARYMVERRGSPSQGWRTFLRNHAPDIAATDRFVVPTVGFVDRAVPEGAGVEHRQGVLDSVAAAIGAMLLEFATPLQISLF